MIRNIIYVEDGSIDIDTLEQELAKDTKIIVYRQGANLPIIEQLTNPIQNAWDNTDKMMMVEIKNLLTHIFESKTVPKLIKKEAENIFADYFD